ncbi:MAG: HYR domain-containing protein [Patiriisocius sp.]|uniref:HYR domain-containing protein n=1 Tax=Patiriisocius sp. TaxID=2822396 RepID=UPI003EF5DF16
MKKITFILIALMVTTFCWTISAQTYSGAGVPLPIGPGSGVVTSSAANVPLVGVVGTNNGEFVLNSIDLSLTHAYAADVEIVLISPAGTRVALCSDNGGSTGLITNPSSLLFTDASTNNITGWDSGAPMADYRAEGGANVFPIGFGDGPGVDLNTVLAGESVSGDWTVQFNDDAGGDGGTLFSYEITFSENIGAPPVINCPMGGMANTDLGVCGAIVNFTDAVALDPEDGAIATTQTMGPASGTVFPVGNTIIEFSATDSDGNTVTCSTTYTVMDMEAPMAMCQDVTLELDLNGNATITAADIDGGSIDNCTVASVVASQTSFGCGDIGANTVTLTVTDDSGNESTCTATVTITDTTAPIITCIGAGGGDFMATEDFEGATVPTGWSTNVLIGAADWQFGSGVTPSATLNDFPTNAAVFDDDAAGQNNVNASELLSPVYDIATATLAELSFEYAHNFFGSGFLRVEVWDGTAWQEVLFVDTLVQPTSTGALDMLPFANDAFQVRFTYDDDGGWSWGAAVDNFLLDVEAPSGSSPLVLDLDEMGMASIDPSDLLISVEDACSVTIEAGGASGGGIPAELNVGFAGGNGLTPGGNFFDINALNDISIQSFDVNIDAGTGTVEVYTKTGTWVGFDSDPAAWTMVGSTTVTSVGENLPTALGLDLDIVMASGETRAFFVATLDIGINYTDGTVTGNVLASDANIEHLEGAGKTSLSTGLLFQPRNFNGIIRYETPDPTSGLVFTCDDLGENLIDVTVTDASGNVSTCTATVIVRDVTAPELVCMDATLELGADGTVTLDPMTLIDMGATVEACGIMSAAADITEFNCDDIGTPVMVTLFVNDLGGNLASCSAMVTVVDMLGPVITCPADITVDPGSGNVNYEVPDYFATGDAMVVDNCTDPVTITTQDPAAGSFLPDGTYPVTLTGTDEYGNVGTCTFTLTVESILGANDNILADGVSLYPNPANNILTIQNSSTQVLESAIIHDINGRMVMNVNLRGAQGDQTLDVSALAAGVYTVQLTSDVASVVKRLIKK